MAIYELSSSHKNNLVIPADLRPKYRNRKKQEISISNFGSIALSLPIYIKYAKAQHGSIAGQDISLAGLYYKKDTNLSIESENIIPLEDSFVDDMMMFASLNTEQNISPENLPFVDQGNTPICTLVSLAHMVQSKLDINMDYTKFIQCLPTENKDLDIPLVSNDNNVQVLNLPAEGRDPIVTKYVNFIFDRKSKCIPITEFCYNTDDKSQIIGDPFASCDDSCADRLIRVKSVTLAKPPELSRKPIATDAQICQIINNGSPFSFGTSGINTKKLILRTILGSDWKNGMSDPPTTEEINNKLQELDIDPSGADSEWNHAMVFVSCDGPDSDGCYRFGILNSWTFSKNKIIKVKSCGQQSSILAILYPYMFDKDKTTIDSTGFLIDFTIRECDKRPKKDPSCECSTPTPTATPEPTTTPYP